MLSEELILNNKNRFIELVNSINRDGMKKEYLIAKLCSSDFFDAPASSMYHLSCRGGLVQHSLNVYDKLVSILSMQYPKSIDEETNTEISTCPYSDDTIKIVALFHDFSKMNYYEVEVKNKKIYSSIGKKKDECGNFDWVSVSGYKTKDISNRFIFGSHENTSLFMAQTYIPMSVEECSAILHHMGGMNFDSAKDDISAIFNKYPLALYLYMADMLSTYVEDNKCNE